ncbi:MAG TPA: hypothetical protein VFI28_09425, partial [Candidatus Limnocylindrales bacterium]|nr:hypothetical protein [Candidatus Limnocylindrales bacterium]
MPDPGSLIALPFAAIAAGSLGLLGTALALGFRHGFDWDHIAAITDITSTTAAADAGAESHEATHVQLGAAHRHDHGGSSELRAHGHGPGTATLALAGGPTGAAARTRSMGFG